MKAYLIAVCILFSAATIGILLSNLFLMVAVGELNQRRSKTNQLSFIWLTPWKIATIAREYRMRCPQGRFLRYARICLIAGFVCFAASACIFWYAWRMAHSGMGY
jgi:hypothetical protein